MDCIIHHSSRLPGQQASANCEGAFDEGSGFLKNPDESLRGHAQPRRRRFCLSPKTYCDDVVVVSDFELSRTKHAKADLVEWPRRRAFSSLNLSFWFAWWVG